MHISDIVEVLGGQKGNKRQRRKFELDDLLAWIRSGLPYSALEALAARLQLDRHETSAVLNIPRRTMARRKQEKKLSAAESDRLFRLAKIAAHGLEILGSEEKVARWLKRPNLALGGRRPLDILDTDLGAREVDDLLARIQHGVYS